MLPENVILIPDRTFGVRLLDLEDGTPVWIVDSPANHEAIVTRWENNGHTDHLTGLTSFVDDLQLSPTDLAASMVATIEEHHGAFSRQPPYSRLTVIGADSSANLTAAIAEVGFELESVVDSKLEFVRKV